MRGGIDGFIRQDDTEVRVHNKRGGGAEGDRWMIAIKERKEKR